MDFSGKVALVTGGASGIGLATAHALAVRGARVAILDTTHARLDAALERLRAAGAADPIAIGCDVGVEAAVARAVPELVEKAGRLDVLVNNAAIMPHVPLVELTWTQWECVLAVNLLGPFELVRAALRHMAAGGTIVNVASVHAFRAQANAGPYAASKAALIALTRTASIEAAGRGIRVNAVVPGAVDTAMLHSNPAVRSGAERLDPNAIGAPEDIAAAIVWLASDAARFVNGTTLVADGGKLAKL